MLLLSRKQNESIIINGNIEIVITEISQDRVRLGINAPREIEIVRKELLLIESENKMAAESIMPSSEFLNIFK